ncbi:MAG TPA: lipid IV(A) 3-deoxy-D-manno-octulosonic acid transferase [Povalibacter sp.]|nr:lipid IV(A) 3-deoxy-D-manno-octulosonic acid transferase [Povalibacter sp.]
MIRLIYRVLVCVAAPMAFAVTVWRGIRDPLYRDRLGERFGFTRVRVHEPSIWVHAVSVGEVQAAATLIRTLHERYPGRTLIVTTATPTGAARVRALFGASVTHVYLPYDLTGSVRRFLERVRPQLGIVLETEVWPTLYRECARRRIPIVLASARLSEKSVRRFQRFSALFKAVLEQDITIAAQTAVDADRFRAVGAPAARIHVTGNIKFDMRLPADLLTRGSELRNSQFGARFVWVAGSTHEGEEDVVLDAHRALIAQRPDALLVLVPRHPNRFERVRQWLGASEVTFVSRSAQEALTPQTQVMLGDTLGELTLFYAACDVAFVGGSFVAIGGHNLLEPAALARPVLTGPNNFNAPDIAKLLVEQGAAIVVDSAASLAATLESLAQDRHRVEAMGHAGVSVLENNRGALERLLSLIEPLLQSRRDA